MSKNNSSGGGASFGDMLTILFIGLKLTDHIDWSWWWVLSPLWITATLVLFFMAFILAFGIEL